MSRGPDIQTGSGVLGLCLHEPSRHPCFEPGPDREAGRVPGGLGRDRHLPATLDASVPMDHHTNTAHVAWTSLPGASPESTGQVRRGLLHRQRRPTSRSTTHPAKAVLTTVNLQPTRDVPIARSSHTSSSTCPRHPLEPRSLDTLRPVGSKGCHRSPPRAPDHEPGSFAAPATPRPTRGVRNDVTFTGDSQLDSTTASPKDHHRLSGLRRGPIGNHGGTPLSEQRRSQWPPYHRVVRIRANRLNREPTLDDRKGATTTRAPSFGDRTYTLTMSHHVASKLRSASM